MKYRKSCLLLPIINIDIWNRISVQGFLKSCVFSTAELITVYGHVSKNELYLKHILKKLRRKKKIQKNNLYRNLVYRKYLY